MRELLRLSECLRIKKYLETLYVEMEEALAGLKDSMIIFCFVCYF